MNKIGNNPIDKRSLEAELLTRSKEKNINFQEQWRKLNDPQYHRDNKFEERKTEERQFLKQGLQKF